MNVKIVSFVSTIKHLLINTQALERMKGEDKYQGQRGYTPGWNLDALRVECHT